ncbi:unnamed protein product [Ceutorhynchus assimilis]|uniref:Uncharacterized protein n=1 Tax=Ceutorhynchus assimilis TaxID=467358 RepID=A0A9N9MC16_9CUCU|nr:unnamed protein product [Ceutorhynchus assimilis]
MLLEFVLNSVSLASGTIQLVLANSASSLLSVLSIVVLVLVQIFVLAWSANEISIAGLSIADAVAASKWEEQTKQVKSLLLVIMMRAQIPIGLTAGPFFQMSTNSALMTVKVAYSYMSFMANNYQ